MKESQYLFNLIGQFLDYYLSKKPPKHETMAIIMMLLDWMTDPEEIIIHKGELPDDFVCLHKIEILEDLIEKWKY